VAVLAPNILASAAELAEPMVRVSGGQSPPEAEALLVFERSMEATNLPS